MGVTMLIGLADGTKEGAVLYDSVSGWPVGPIWEGRDAADQAEAFLQWVGTSRWLDLHKQIFGEAHRIRVTIRSGDLREFADLEIQQLIKYWRSIYVDDQGWLIDTKECVCGSGHHHDGEGCLQCDCNTFVPTTEAGRIDAAHA